MKRRFIESHTIPNKMVGKILSQKESKAFNKINFIRFLFHHTPVILSLLPPEQKKEWFELSLKANDPELTAAILPFHNIGTDDDVETTLSDRLVKGVNLQQIQKHLPKEQGIEVDAFCNQLLESDKSPYEPKWRKMKEEIIRKEEERKEKERAERLKASELAKRKALELERRETADSRDSAPKSRDRTPEAKDRSLGPKR